MKTSSATPPLSISKFALLAFVVAGCTSTPLVRSRLMTSSGPIVIESKTSPPAWLDTVPRASGYHYAIGEAEGAESREQALEKAWISAFVRFGMTEFPQLTSISSRNIETLRGSQFERRFAIHLEAIDWTGVKEETEVGSPFVVFDRKSHRFLAFRLLKWAESDIIKARQALKANVGVRKPLPLAPEASTSEEKALVDAVRQIQRVNHRVAYRNVYLDRVLGEIKCGVTIDDLTHILGSPDRANPFNDRLVEKEYYWGEYRVEAVADNPSVAAITHAAEPRRVVCEALDNARESVVR